MNSDTYTYSKYVSIGQQTRWASEEEVQASGSCVRLSEEAYPAAGLPLLSDGKTAYVDDTDTHSLIFGATGSKKTRLFCMPMINFFTRAGESFVVTDPKGELYARTSGMAKAKGYNVVVLNFRDIGKGSMWNPLALPLEYYRNGKKDIAISMLNDFVATISAPMRAGMKDVFWVEMAASYALANLLILMEAAQPEEVNVASLARMCSEETEDPLKLMVEKMRPETLASINLQGVLSGAENTRRSVYVTLFGMLRIFNTQESLTRMLSGNTVDMRGIGREKTAVYVIVPDEKTTYHFLVTSFIKQTYEQLIAQAQEEAELKLPVRVNFVLDEFCNMPAIPDMASMISAARSRNMRFYLVAQSLHQLRGKYGEDADTIKGNCENWVFLTSRELELLNEVSELCGSITTAADRSRPLISVSELQRLDKEKGEALIMHARLYPFIAQMADIDSYEMFKGYPPCPMEPFAIPEAKIFSTQMYTVAALKGEKPWPFADHTERKEYYDL